MAGKQPLKILFCIDAMACGGTELQLKGLIERLDRTRFQPVLCTIRPSNAEFEPENCERLRLDVPRLVSPGGIVSIVKMASWLRKNDVAIVQTFFQDATVFAGVAAWLARTPCRMASFRDMAFWAGSRETGLTKKVYALMTDFAANAQAVKNHFVKRFGVRAERVTVIPNGIDAAALQWLEHPGPTTDVVIVGNLNRRVKRTDLFIRAAAKVAATRPEIRWHVVGDGEFRPELEALAAECGLGDNVVFAGRLTDVPSYLAKMQIAVLCSDSEGFSNAILEYMLIGCAVIATDVGGNPESVLHEKTGLLVPADDAEALAAALERMVADPELRQKYAAAARAFVVETFDWPQCVRAHEDFYEQCLR